MIRWFFDVWAGTTFGLVVNLLVFLCAMLLPVGMITAMLNVFGFTVLAVYFWGASRGWDRADD